MSAGHTGVTDPDQPVRAEPAEHAGPVCDGTREVLDRVGDRWSMLVVMELATRDVRFRDLQRAVGGISQRMLTLTLRRLQRDGLVGRTVFPTTPPAVQYALTPLGATLHEQVRALVGWAAEHRAEVGEARRRFDAEQVLR
jgi:DNA-binding HxlR family transcriptional regulator